VHPFSDAYLRELFVSALVSACGDGVRAWVDPFAMEEPCSKDGLSMPYVSAVTHWLHGSSSLLACSSDQRSRDRSDDGGVVFKGSCVANDYGEAGRRYRWAMAFLSAFARQNYDVKFGDEVDLIGRRRQNAKQGWSVHRLHLGRP